MNRSHRLLRAIRHFSSTTRSQARTSHIGREPIKFSPDVSLTLSPSEVSVKGPLGTTSVPLMPFMQLAFPDPGTLTVAVEDPEIKKQRSMWGLTRTLINNAIIGMTEGFSVPLYLVGVGYRVALEDDPRRTPGGGNGGPRLNMKLGFSHPVIVKIPPHIKAEVPYPTKIILSCTDKHQLGLFAARVKQRRPPEPYKGKVNVIEVVAIVPPQTHVFSRAYSLGTSRLGSRASKRNSHLHIHPLLCQYQGMRALYYYSRSCLDEHVHQIQIFILLR
jgi:large subunit ribosomal protein L6